MPASTVGALRLARRWAAAAVRSLGARLLVLVTVVTGSFMLFYVAPGDAARTMLGANASTAAVSALRRDLGLEDSLAQQLSRQLSELVRGDLGVSIVDGRSVVAEVTARGATTLRLACSALGIAVVMALGAALMNHRGGRAAHLGESALRHAAMIPIVATGTVAAMVAARVAAAFGGFSELLTFVAPAAVAALIPASILSSFLSKASADPAGRTLLLATRALGYPEWRTFWRVVLAPQAVGCFTVLVNYLGAVVISSVILEVVFTLPGLGTLLVTSIQQRDFPMLRGLLVVNATFFLSLTWFNDAVISWLDPRVRR